MSNDWMTDILAMAEAHKDAPPPQYPIAYYNRGGDGIQATLREHDMTHTRWLPGGVVELVIEEGTDEVVGFNVWGIKHLMREAEERHQFYVRRDEERAMSHGLDTDNGISAGGTSNSG